MKTVELSAALNSAQVVENLKNFVGVDAQGAAALMTPERLAAVAGELDRRFDYFFSGNIVKEQSGDEEPLTIANDVLKWIPSRLCSFSVVYHKWSNILVTGYIYEDKKHGYFTVRKLAQLPVNIDLTDGRMNIIQ